MKHKASILLLAALLTGMTASCGDTAVQQTEQTTQNTPDTTTADKAAEIIGYAPHTVLSYIRQKRIFAVQISGKYILPKSALVEFIISDAAFEIVHKSTWHLNTILMFVEKQ